MKKRFVSLALTVLLLAALCIPALAADRSWEAEYRTQIVQCADNWGTVYQLVDLDVDGTPELLIGSRPGSGLFSEVEHVFTYKDGALKELTYTDGMCLGSDDYVLYRKNSNGDYRIESAMTVRAGAGYYDQITALYTLSGGKLTDRPTFVKSTAGMTVTYLVNGTKVGSINYGAAYNSRNSGWTRVNGYGCASLSSYDTPSASKISKLFSDYVDGPALCVPSTHNLKVDDNPVSLAAYNINGNNFFKLRDIASILNGTPSQFSVGWDGTEKRITLVTGEAYVPDGTERAAGDGLRRFGLPTDASLFVNGAQSAPTAYNIEGNNYFKLRDLADLLGFTVEWDEATQTICISSDNWDAKVGTTVAKIQNADGSFTDDYGKNNLSYQGGYTGQCTWYAYGRFLELTGIALNSAPTARDWLNKNKNDPRVKIVSDICPKSIAVRTSGTSGHVMIIENVIYNEDGSPETVYFTECNMDINGTYNAGTDCVVEKMSYADFIRTRLKCTDESQPKECYIVAA